VLLRAVVSVLQERDGRNVKWAVDGAQVLTLLAFLAQKYKY
jgi:hypothetical protein